METDYLDLDEKADKSFADENGQRHFLKKMIGKGGQGEVWSTKSPDIIIKLKTDEEGNIIRDPEIYEKYKKQIDEVRILNLPENIHIARPAVMLKKPVCGYAMILLEGMMPVKNLIKDFEDKKRNFTEYYRDSGGLRYRYKILENIAEIFTQLYVSSAVYADISPDNIFISDNPKYEETWLIDADNLRYCHDIKKGIRTPGYGAPEIIKNKINTVKSDEYSFAVLAHEILTSNLPFNGELYESSEENSWDKTLEASEEIEDIQLKAERGDFPWIEDPEDDRNRSSYGIPGRYVFTPKLKELFYKNFSREGKENPDIRPSMREWHKALREAADRTALCPKCGNTFLMNSPKDSCPFCNSRREEMKIILAQIKDEYDLSALIEEENRKIEEFNEKNEAEVQSVKDEDLKHISTQNAGIKIFDYADGREQYLYNYHVAETSFYEKKYPAVIISKDKKDVYTVRNESGKAIAVHTASKDYGCIEYRSTAKFDNLDGKVFSLPMDKNNFRTRHIKFFVL